ncbi:MAG: YkgJ family cysteine cluster protein [Promethearchaeota archaeon]
MITFEDFKEFHLSFKGEFFQECVECGGKCEYTTICPLLPGEKQYIAHNLKMNVKEFEEKFLDGINTPYGIIDVLKLIPLCPFLDKKNYNCLIREFKPVFCAIYPIIITQTEPKLKFDIDSCPLSKNPSIYKYFEEKGFSALSKLDIPKDWAKAIMLFDDKDYDYQAMQRIRKDNKYQIFDLNEINKFTILNKKDKKKIILEEINKISESLSDEDYRELASIAFKFRNYLIKNPHEEDTEFLTIVASFFHQFARAYEIWQVSYHYPEIREKWYSAESMVKNYKGDPIKKKFCKILELLIQAMYAYTHCENSVIISDVKALYFYSNYCVECEERARDIISQIKNEFSYPNLINNLEDYLIKNFHLHSGLNKISKLHLKLENEDFTNFSELFEELNQIKTDYLDKLDSEELVSELNAHYIFLKKKIELNKDKYYPLIINNGTIKWILNSYINEKITKMLYHIIIENNRNIIEFSDLLEECMDLTFEAPIQPLRIPDIFETALGEENITGLEIALDEIDVFFHKRIFRINILVKISVLGICSVIFSSDIKHMTIDETRPFRTLITPHTGQCLYYWKDIIDFEMIEKSKLEKSEIYTLYPFKTIEFSKSLLNNFPNIELLKKFQSYLEEYIDNVNLLLKLNQEEYDKEKKKDKKIIRKKIINITYQMIEELKIIEKETNNENLSALIRETYTNIVLSNPEFLYLENIGKKIFKKIRIGIKKFLDISMEKNLIHKIEDIQEIKDKIEFISDHSMFWATIMYPRHISTIQNQKVKLDYKAIKNHKDFIALALYLRESRASIGDWILTALPEVKNFAKIRSHKTDLFILDDNQSILYFYDDPMYLMDQYLISAEIVFWIRTLVYAYHKKALIQLEKIKEFLSKEAMISTKNQLQDKLNVIEMDKIKVIPIIDLLSSVSFSKYRDHGILMKNLVENTTIPVAEVMLIQTIKNINQLGKYINEILDRQIQEKQEKMHRTQQILSRFIAIGITMIPIIEIFLTLGIDFIWIFIIALGAISGMGFYCFFEKKRYKKKLGSSI